MHVRVSNRSAIPSTSATITLHSRLGAILAVAPNPVAGGQTEVSLRLAATLGGATLQGVFSFS